MTARTLMYTITCGECGAQRFAEPDAYERGDRGSCWRCNPLSIVVCPVCNSTREIPQADAKADNWGECPECAKRKRIDDAWDAQKQAQIVRRGAS